MQRDAFVQISKAERTENEILCEVAVKWCIDRANEWEEEKEKRGID